MKILLLRIGRLGDIVMILPAIAEIKRRFPQAEYYAVTSADGVRLLKTIGFKSEQLLHYRNSIFYRFCDAMKVKRFIRQGNFDKIYCFEGKKRTVSWLPAQAVSIPPAQQLVHYALRCLKLVDPQVSNLYQESYLPYDQGKMEQLLHNLQTYGIGTNTVLIGLHPSYSGFKRKGRQQEHCHRLWPWQNFAELAVKFALYGKEQGIDIKIIMDLLPEERELGLKIQQASQGKIILLSEKPDFQRYLCYLKRLSLLVVANTGTMHLAAALNTPVLALFSLLHPGDCGPYMPAQRFKVLRAEDTAKKELGLAALTVEQVFASGLQLLQNQQG